MNVRYFVPNGRVVSTWYGKIESFPIDEDRIKTKIGNIQLSAPPEIPRVQAGGSRKKKRKSKRNKSKNKRSKKKKSKKKSKKR